MEPLRIRIERIVDFGPVVSLVGTDLETQLPVNIHIDHRPFSVFEKELGEAGLRPLIEYEADRLVLHLDLLPAANAKRVRLVEIGGTRPGAASNHAQPARELDR